MAKEAEKAAKDKADAIKAERNEIEVRMAALLGTQASAVKGVGFEVGRAVVNGKLTVDHEGLLNALLLKKPELKDELKEFEHAFINYGGGYTRWNLRKEK
jgi:hypothetical protein